MGPQQRPHKNTMQWVLKIGELMFGYLRGRVAFKVIITTIYIQCLFFLLLSSAVIWAIFVQAPLSLSSSLFSCTALWTLCSAAYHRVPTWIIWTRMKTAVVEPEARWYPWHPAACRWGMGDWGCFKNPDSETALHIIAHTPASSVLCCSSSVAFKGQTALDNKVFISCGCSLWNNRVWEKWYIDAYLNTSLHGRTSCSYSIGGEEDKGRHAVTHTQSNTSTAPSSLSVSLQVNTESQMASGAVQNELVLKAWRCESLAFSKRSVARRRPPKSPPAFRKQHSEHTRWSKQFSL